MLKSEEINIEHENTVYDKAYDYYGDRMATCLSDQFVKVWDKEKEGKWTLTSSWKASSASIWKVNWAHPKYGHILAICSSDRTASIWEKIDTSELDKQETKHWVCRTNLGNSRNSVTDVKFGPKSRGLQLATCSAEGIIRIYEAPDVTNLSQWTLQHEIQCKLPLSCLDWNSTLSRLHPPMIAVGSDGAAAGGKVIIYEFSQNSRKWIKLDTIKSITGPVSDVAFAPNLERSFHILGVATNKLRVIKLTLVKEEPSAQKGLTELDLPIPVQFDEHDRTIRRVCWNVNGTVLASHGDDLCVRIFKSSTRAELCLLPRNEDEACHEAFYYAIRSGNIELLNTLIDRWPGNYFSTHPNKLDGILSNAYAELKLKNVPLSEQIEFFIESKLINLRFFSNSIEQGSHVNGNLNNVKERIDLVLRSINDLKTEYLNTNRKVNEKHLFIATFIAQNIHVLKRQLKSTYAKLPWEEIEFCLIAFVSSHTKQKEINLFYHATLNKTKLLNHLENFAKRLNDEKSVIGDVNIDKLGNLPNIKREKVIAAVINNYPQFEELYNDYQQIRDIHSLQKISSYIKLALLADPKESKGQLMITRAIQVIGEYLKNTLESPKLSNNTSELLLLSLPKNTREIIIGLRNSLSHANSLSRRIEIEENTDVSFFIGVQNDTKRIDNVINDILYNNKIKTVGMLLNKIIDSENVDDINEVVEMLGNVKIDKLIPENFKMMEHEKLEKLVKELSDNIIEKTDHEKKLFENINNLINSVGSAEIKVDYIAGLAFLTSVSRLWNDMIPDHNVIRGIKFSAKRTSENMSSKIEPRLLKDIALRIVQLYNCVKPRIQPGNLDEIDRLVSEMFYIAQFGTGDLKYIEELRGRLNAKGSFIPFYKDRKIGNLTAKKYNNQLSLKLSELKTILDSNIFSETFSLYNDLKLQAVIEMLVLDILSILGDSNNYLENNLLFLDDNTPSLNGKCLRNHLAHDNALVDILLSNPSITVISNARKLISEDIMKGNKRLGKLVIDDPSKLQDKYDQGVATIANQERMFDALEKGNLEVLKSCLKKGDIRARDIKLWTTLHFAAKGPSLEIIKFILDQNLSLNVKDNNGQNVLHIAAAHGRNNIVKFFIKEAGLYVDELDNLGKTPLHMAAQNGFQDTVAFLLENNASTIIQDIAGLPPLNYAMRNNHIDVVKILLKTNVDVDINETKGGYTPLHEAAERGLLEIVNLLLLNKARVNAKIDRGWTPLHAAALNGHLEVINTLIVNGADVTAAIIDGCTSLHYAVETGHENIANILLKHGANVNAADKTYNNTPLHYAAKDGHDGIVKTLLKHKANANIATVHGITPLHFAAQSGFLEIVSILLNHRVNIHAKDLNNATPLHYAAESGHKEVAELLVNSRADINAKSFKHATPIHTAALNGHKHVTEFLVKCKADVNCRDFTGETPLHAAAMNGSKDIVDLLIENNAKVNAKTNNGMTPLHIAAFKGHEKAIVCLIKNKAEINAKDSLASTPLHSAVLGGHNCAVNLLIKNNGEVDSGRTGDRTPLYLAVEANNKEIVKILAANGACVNIKRNHPSLICAIHNNNKEIVEILLANGADVNAESGALLSLAVLAGYRDIVEILLKNKARVNINNSCNLAPLYLAAKTGHQEIVKALITRGAAVDGPDSEITPLFIAAQEGHKEVVKVLLENRANANFITASGTALHIAATYDHENVVEVLLNNGAKTNIKDNKNRTALQLAVAHGRLQVVKRLLQHQKVDLNAKGKDDWTILHIASQGNNRRSNVEMVKYLVNEGADINARNAAGSKSIHIAAREGYKDTVKYFLSKGLGINESGAANQTLIHYAAMKGHTKVVKYLITRGADVNVKDGNGSTPMHMAAECDSKDVINILLNNGAIYNSVDNLYRTPLKLTSDGNVISLLTSTEQLFDAVKHNSSSDVENSIKAGANVNAKNLDIVTPLHYAAWKGYERIVDALLQNKANPAAVGKQGLTPLHYAAKFSHLKVVNVLLSNGAIFNALSDSGKTPLDLTVDKDITSLFKIVSESFNNVKNDNCQVVNILSRIKDIEKLKSIMNACDRENKTLIIAAVHNNFSKVKELKQISQGDVGSQITIALLLLNQGEYQNALKMFKNVLEKRKELLGPDNPGTLDIQTHIATVLYKQGAYQEALNMLEDIFKRRKRILGLNDEDTLNTRSTIALVLHRLGKDEEASHIFKEVYPKQSEILGPNHSDTLNSQFHLALVLDRQGKYEEALNINKAVFENRKEKLGINDPVTISTQNNIAMVLTNQGKYEEALKMYNEVYLKKKLILGINHADTLRTLHNMAGILCHQKKYQEALKAYQEVSNIQMDILGPNHPDTLNTQNNMGNMLFQQGKWISSLKAFRKCLDRSKAVFGPNYPSVLDMLKKIEVIKEVFKLQCTNEAEVLRHLQTEINIAAANGDVETVQSLLKAGIDIDDKDIDGRTPLHYAVGNGQINVVNILLKNGADVTHATNKGNTPLHTAASNGNIEIIEVLLQNVKSDKLNSFINAKTAANGTTSLHVAAKNGSLDIVKSLLKHGATYNIKNREGKNPLDLSNDQSIKDLLKRVEELFGDVKKGNIEVINKFSVLKRDEFLAVSNVRNFQGNTLLQVAIANKQKNIASKLLETLKRTC